MANWIIPCNPKYFDVFGAYGKLKSIDWNQSAKSIDVGDNVYIYVGKPVQAIMFKTRVVATGITAEEVDYSDQEFDLEANQGSMEPDREKRWMRLELIKSYSNRDLSFNKLVQYGLKGNIQGPRRTDEDIQGLIDMVDPPTEESIQLTNAPGAREEKDQENRKDKNKDYEVNTETGSYSKLIDAELKNMSYQTLSARFREWLERSGFKAVSIPTIISDCFYLWRKKSPEQFWLAVEGDEKTSYAMLHQALAENSSANPDNVIRGYVLQIGRFRQFANSWSGREMHSNQKAGQRITENRQHQVEPVFPVNGSASINAGKDNRRIEKKLDSLISVISAMSSKKGISEDVKKEAEIETDKRFRIEITNGTATFLMLSRSLVITGLAFGMKFYAIGPDGATDHFRIYFVTHKGTNLSEMQELAVTVGDEYECRFELKTAASEEEAVFLVIQNIYGKEDEVRQLIKCPVKIAFAADFGI